MIWKTIRISDETHELVNSIGKRGETFDEIINRIFKEFKKKEKK